MANTDEVIRLPHLREGLCDGFVVVKVDRIVNKEVVRYPLGLPRPMKELQAVQIIVFDELMKRKVVVLDEDSVIGRLAPMFGEERCYKISNFLVRRHGEGSRMKLYIKLHPDTHVDYSLNLDLPKYCFELRCVSHVLSGIHNSWGLIDVCGILKTIVEPGLGHSGGVYCKEVVLLLVDSGVVAVGTHKVLSCTLQGECADTTMRAYETVGNDDNVFVVIQYAMVVGNSHCGPSLASFHNATRVFFNPTYPEVYQQRINMLHRLLPDPDGSTLPIV